MIVRYVMPECTVELLTLHHPLVSVVKVTTVHLMLPSTHHNLLTISVPEATSVLMKPLTRNHALQVRPLIA